MLKYGSLFDKFNAITSKNDELFFTRSAQMKTMLAFYSQINRLVALIILAV